MARRRAAPSSRPFWGLLLVAAVAGAAPTPRFASLPAAKGIHLEAQAILAAPAAQVAAVAADPSAFVELFPALSARVLGAVAGAPRVEVTMKAPWPVRRVTWVERVELSPDADGQGYVIHRVAEPGYYRSMEVTCTVRPRADGQSDVTYRVQMEIAGWAPQWIVRRGIIDGATRTLDNLERMARRLLPPAPPLAEKQNDRSGAASPP